MDSPAPSGWNEVGVRAAEKLIDAGPVSIVLGSVLIAVLAMLGLFVWKVLWPWVRITVAGMFDRADLAIEEARLSRLQRADELKADAIDKAELHKRNLLSHETFSESTRAHTETARLLAVTYAKNTEALATAAEKTANALASVTSGQHHEVLDRLAAIDRNVRRLAPRPAADDPHNPE